MSGLSEQDHTDLKRAVALADEAIGLIRGVEGRHAIDMTGPALSAFERADIELAMAERDVRLAERYMG